MPVNRPWKDVVLNFYDLFMKPLESLLLGGLRKKVIPSAKGNVLEAGIGTGANLFFYDYSNITNLTGLDSGAAPEQKKFPAGVVPGVFRFIRGDIENPPFPREIFDCVVATLLLCSVKDLEKSIGEIRRILKPHGTFIFLEHIRPSGSAAARACDILDKTWSGMAKGCHLNRRTDFFIKRGGFTPHLLKQKGVFLYGIAEKKAL